MKDIFTKLRLYISPLFLARYYNLKAVSTIVDKYKFNGRILDVGCGDKPYKYLFKYGTDYKGIDFKEYSTNNCFPYTEPPDFYFRKNYVHNYRLPFDNEQFDHAVAFQVLEHHEKPDVMFSEIFRVVKKGGYVLITVPFMGGIHGEPQDFQRFTRYGLKVRAEKYGKILELVQQGSLFSVISTFFGEALIRFTGKSKFHYFLGMMIFPPFLVYSYLAFILDKILPSRHIFLNYLLLVERN